MKIHAAKCSKYIGKPSDKRHADVKNIQELHHFMGKSEKSMVAFRRAWNIPGSRTSGVAGCAWARTGSISWGTTGDGENW